MTHSVGAAYRLYFGYFREGFSGTSVNNILLIVAFVSAVLAARRRDVRMQADRDYAVSVVQRRKRFKKRARWIMIPLLIGPPSLIYGLTYTVAGEEMTFEWRFSLVSFMSILCVLAYVRITRGDNWFGPFVRNDPAMGIDAV